MVVEYQSRNEGSAVQDPFGMVMEELESLAVTEAVGKKYREVLKKGYLLSSNML